MNTYYLINLLVYAAVDAMACLGLSQQFGVAGVTNFGFIVFQAAGGYAAAILALPPDTAYGGFQSYIGGWHLPFPIPWLGAAAAGGLVALPFTFLFGRRIRGDFAAVGLLVTAVLLNLLATNYRPFLNGDAGLSLIPEPLQGEYNPQATSYQWVFTGAAVLVCLATYFFVRRITESPYGRSLRAMRDNDVVADSIGKNLLSLRTAMLVAGGMIAGLSGGILVSYITTWSPATWGYAETVVLFAAVIIGGAGNHLGAILGAILVPVGFEEVTRFIPTSNNLPPNLIPSLEWVAIGILIVVFLWVRPQGLVPERTRKIPLAAPDTAPIIARPMGAGPAIAGSPQIASRPGASQPGASQPGAPQPGAFQPGASQPDSPQPGAFQPDSPRPDASSQPGAFQPDSPRPDASSQPVAFPDSPRPGMGAVTRVPGGADAGDVQASRGVADGDGICGALGTEPGAEGRSTAADSDGPAADGVVLEARDLVRDFGGLRAVNDVSFCVRHGTLTGLIGPNGAGKSTLLAMLAGTVRASSGRVIYGGQDISSVPAFGRARAGLVRTFQLASEFKRLTVMENLLSAVPRHRGDSFHGAMLGRRYWRADETAAITRAEALLERFGLEAFANHHAGDLSGGQRRLVEIMRALMAQPHMLLLDEPMAGVHPHLARRLGHELLALCQEGMTILMVEHELAIMDEFCDPVIVMAAGSVLAEGTMTQLRRRQEVVEAYLVG